MYNPELLMAEAYDEGVVSEVIRPAAIIPEDSARAVLVELAIRDVHNRGVWQSEPTLWSRYDGPWEAYGSRGSAELIGTIQVAYGSPTRYDITIYRATVTKFGTDSGWTVVKLCDEALAYGGLDLGTRRASIRPGWRIESGRRRSVFSFRPAQPRLPRKPGGSPAAVCSRASR